ncbi:MAG: hypothetical protein WBG36_16575, partial [Ornithinimicrobium sp.]
TEGPSPDGMRVTQAATVAQAAAAAFGDTEAPEEPRGRPPSAIDSGHDKIGTRPGIETRSGAGAT